MKNDEVTLIAGPCSVDAQNLDEIYTIAELKTAEGASAVYGTRVVGLKSRTGYSKDGAGMGMDYAMIAKNLALLTAGTGYRTEKLAQLPSIELAAKIQSETGLLIATEIMFPAMQMALFERAGFSAGKLLAWNPAVNQLGWQILETALIAGKNDWQVGLKNPKWLGEQVKIAETEAYSGETSLEKSWKGLVSYAAPASGIVLIQRGVDVDNKGAYRNVPVHFTAARTKQAVLNSGQKVQLFFDPSHSYGPQMREAIPQAIISGLQLKLNDYEYLYDGILVEAGTSKTDTEQHISIEELKAVIREISKFRKLRNRSV